MVQDHYRSREAASKDYTHTVSIMVASQETPGKRLDVDAGLDMKLGP